MCRQVIITFTTNNSIKKRRIAMKKEKTAAIIFNKYKKENTERGIRKAKKEVKRKINRPFLLFIYLLKR